MRSVRRAFPHYKQSVRVVEVVEKKGRGLNLTKEVRDGILNHRTAGNPSTLEGKIVRFLIRSLISTTTSTTPYGDGSSPSMTFPEGIRRCWEIL